MKSIRITYTNGNTTETDINGTDAEIRAYYLGRNAWFNMGIGDGPDVMVRAQRVEFLNPDGTVRELTPQGVIKEAMNACGKGHWDGVIVLDAARYRLAGINFGPSTVAQMPAYAEPLVTDLASMPDRHTKVIKGLAVTRWNADAFEVGTWGKETVTLSEAVELVGAK